MSHAPHPHDHPPRQRFEPPAAAMVVRGLFLLAGAALGALGTARAARRPAGVFVAPGLAVVSLLLAWAGAIHVGGGARFDDHPWV